MSTNLSRLVQPFVTSVIVGKDVVPRVSVVNLGRLIDQMVSPGHHPWHVIGRVHTRPEKLLFLRNSYVALANWRNARLLLLGGEKPSEFARLQLGRRHPWRSAFQHCAQYITPLAL